MNINKLLETASPGPFIAGGPVILDDESGVEMSFLIPDVTVETAVANAAVFAHCRNNFMRALEALKEEHQIVVAYESKLANAVSHCPECCDVYKLIAELEEVKM